MSAFYIYCCCLQYVLHVYYTLSIPIAIYKILLCKYKVLVNLTNTFKSNTQMQYILSFVYNIYYKEFMKDLPYILYIFMNINS